MRIINTDDPRIFTGEEWSVVDLKDKAMVTFAFRQLHIRERIRIASLCPMADTLEEVDLITDLCIFIPFLEKQNLKNVFL